ncbi:MAG TPA: hypothetical protein V6C76_04800 [Drouetiella sp.]
MSITNAKFLYLFKESEDELRFMNVETFEQVTCKRTQFGRAADFLKEGVEGIEAIYVEGMFAQMRLPKVVALKVMQTNPGSENDNRRLALLETGATISVPLTVCAGQIVEVATETGEFLRVSVKFNA